MKNPNIVPDQETRENFAKQMNRDSLVWTADTEGPDATTLVVGFRNRDLVPPKTITDAKVRGLLRERMPESIKAAKGFGFRNIKVDIRHRFVTCAI